MDFGFSEEQDMLRRSVRGLLGAHSGYERVRAIAESDDPVDRDLWRRMAELGLQGILVPEAHGGTGMSPVELIVVCEELGRFLAPVPFLSSAAAATTLLLEAGSEGMQAEWLPKLASGSAVLAPAWLEDEGTFDWSSTKTRAVRCEDGWVLEGTKQFVTDAAAADAFLVLARREDGLGIHLLDAASPGTRLESLIGIDGSRREADLVLWDARVPAHRAAVAREHALDRARDLAALVLAAEMVGNAEAMLHMAVEYSRVREQFGRPIGSFQALKHMAADLLVGIETGKSLVYYAAMTASESDRGEASRAAAAAKGYMSGVVARTATDTVQMHGGIGFTWEHNLHLHYKRAKWQQLCWGEPAWYEDLLAGLEGL